MGFTGNPVGVAQDLQLHVSLCQTAAHKESNKWAICSLSDAQSQNTRDSAIPTERKEEMETFLIWTRMDIEKTFQAVGPRDIVYEWDPL